jgi:N-alpha-acetyltransferase 15/16, NatA auxiliary subunit
MIESTDVVLSHRFFQAAGQGVLQVMLSRLDDLANPKPVTGESEGGALSATDKKKEKNKLKKLKKKEDGGATASAGEEKGEEKGLGKKASKDEDPLGEKILQKDPLEEAVRWSVALTRQGCKDPNTHALVSETMCRKGRFVFALRSLRAGLAIERDHPGCTLQLLKFGMRFHGLVSGAERWVMKPLVQEVVAEKLAALLGGAGPESVAAYGEAFIARAAGGALSLPHRVAAARCILLLTDKADGQRAASLLLDEALWDQRGVTAKNAAAAMEVSQLMMFIDILYLVRCGVNQMAKCELQGVNGAEATFVGHVRQRYPLSNLFCEATPLFKGVEEGELGDV